FEVAVNDTLFMGRGQAVRDAEGVLDGFALWRCAVSQALPQGFAFEQLRNDVGRAVLRAHVVDGEDIGVVQGAWRLDVLLETTQPVGVLGEAGRQHLDGHLAANARVAGAVDLAHAAGAERRQNFVWTEPGGWSERHRYEFTAGRGEDVR